MTKLFQHSPDNPFHISVGVLLVNEQGEILVHKARAADMDPEYRYKLGGLDEAYILMRESLENGETLEQGVARGLQEEFGVEGNIERYLGSLQFEVEGFEKITLFFQVSFVKQDKRLAGDAEGFTELVWMEPKVLVEHMRDQGARATRKDLDESKIVEAYIKYGRA
jgi:isopentenyldiphosphate isomerase